MIICLDINVFVFTSMFLSSGPCQCTFMVNKLVNNCIFIRLVLCVSNNRLSHP